jgi:hypothetical protein
MKTKTKKAPVTDLSRFAVIEGNVGFEPLPVEEHRVFFDNSCCCPYCSPDGISRPSVNCLWDTRATNLKTGETWLIHHPELHGLAKLGD